MDLAGKNFYYTNPLDANAQRTPWHNCPCCVGNIARTLLMLPTWMYSKAADAVYVNLFVGGRVGLGEVAGTEVEMVQATDYPWDGKVTITVNPKASGEVRRADPRAEARRQQPLPRDAERRRHFPDRRERRAWSKPAEANGYVEIARVWKTGRHDRARAADAGPARLRQRQDRGGRRPAIADEGQGGAARGPLVYNIEEVDQDINGVLAPSAPLAAEWRDRASWAA